MVAEPARLEDLHPDLLTRALRLLDGPTLAAAAASSSLFRSISDQSHLWLHLSLSTFPSLRHPLTLPFLSSSPRCFFSDVFPSPDASPSPDGFPSPDRLISAVDIFHRGLPIFSRVIETETSSLWFRGSPFLIDAMDPKAEFMRPGVVVSPEEITMSWILIDPALGRAVNVSSRQAVGVERNCYTGETMVRFATASAAAEKVIGAVVTCGEEDGRVRDVVLTAEDLDGACVSGGEAVRVVRGMMEARRIRCGEDGEEMAKHKYSEFLRRKRGRKERRARREGLLDMCCTAVGVAVFLGFVSMIVFL